MEVPGVLVVWTGSEPVSRAFRISEGGLVLGRELVGDTDDDRLSRQHVHVESIGSRFEVEDLSGRGATYAGGRAVEGRVQVPERTVVRTGRTVSVLVGDIRPYEGVPVTRRQQLVSGALTRTLHAELAAAAVARAHVVITGAGGSGRGYLARRYRDLLATPDDTLLEENVSGPGADKVDERLAMLVSVPSRRIVMTVNDLSSLHPRLEAWLREAARWFALPALRDRPDELAAIVHDTIRARGAALTCHASLVECCLIASRDLGLLVGDLELTASTVLERGETMIRAETLRSAVQSRWVMFRPG